VAEVVFCERLYTSTHGEPKANVGVKHDVVEGGEYVRDCSTDEGWGGGLEIGSSLSGEVIGPVSDALGAVVCREAG
jgi:hypothetical protein